METSKPQCRQNSACEGRAGAPAGHTPALAQRHENIQDLLMAPAGKAATAAEGTAGHPAPGQGIHTASRTAHRRGVYTVSQTAHRWGVYTAGLLTDGASTRSVRLLTDGASTQSARLLTDGVSTQSDRSPMGRLHSQTAHRRGSLMGPPCPRRE